MTNPWLIWLIFGSAAAASTVSWRNFQKPLRCATVVIKSRISRHPLSGLTVAAFSNFGHEKSCDSVAATVLGRRAMEPAAAFAVYCTGSRSSISVFECKCALLRGLGVNLTVKQIAAHLTASCGWVADGSGVSQAQFTDLYNTLKNSNGCVKENSHYDTYDMRGKGWITEDDVYRVCAPHFSRTKRPAVLCSPCICMYDGSQCRCFHPSLRNSRTSMCTTPSHRQTCTTWDRYVLLYLLATPPRGLAPFLRLMYTI